MRGRARGPGQTASAPPGGGRGGRSGRMIERGAAGRGRAFRARDRKVPALPPRVGARPVAESGWVDQGLTNPRPAWEAAAGGAWASSPVQNAPPTRGGPAPPPPWPQEAGVTSKMQKDTQLAAGAPAPHSGDGGRQRARLAVELVLPVVNPGARHARGDLRLWPRRGLNCSLWCVLGAVWGALWGVFLGEV
jgi:hypothetical protein